MYDRCSLRNRLTVISQAESADDFEPSLRVLKASAYSQQSWKFKYRRRKNTATRTVFHAARDELNNLVNRMSMVGVYPAFLVLDTSTGLLSEDGDLLHCFKVRKLGNYCRIRFAPYPLNPLRTHTQLSYDIVAGWLGWLSNRSTLCVRGSCNRVLRTLQSLIHWKRY